MKDSNMKHLKKFYEGLESTDEYLKDDLEDALQTFEAIMRIMNGDHPTINKDDEKFEDLLSYAKNNYYREDSQKSIKNLLKRI